MMPTTPTGSRVTSGHELEDGAGASRLADALRFRLAFFAREQRAELFLAREEGVADGIENVGALLRRRARPGRPRGFRGGDGGLGLMLVGLGIMADHVVDIRGIDVGAGIGPLGPFAGDVIAVVGHRVLPCWRER
jgi:hypothetical protein